MSGDHCDRSGAGRPDTAARETGGWRPTSYWPFVLPALIVVLAVIIFPWVYTIWMSLHDWNIGAPPVFVGLANYIRLPDRPALRRVDRGTPLSITVLAVVAAAGARHPRGAGVPRANFRCAAFCAASSSCR